MYEEGFYIFVGVYGFFFVDFDFYLGYICLLFIISVFDLNCVDLVIFCFLYFGLVCFV